MRFTDIDAFLCVQSEETNCGEVFFSCGYATCCPACENRDVQAIHEMSDLTLQVVEGDSR